MAEPDLPPDVAVMSFEAALAELRVAAAGETNLMYPIIAAARADVTMGEMCDALRDVWGIWRETPVF